MNINIEALRRARDIVKATPAENIDLALWRSSCGTVACVIGHCAMDGWFNNKGKGLTLDEDLVPKYKGLYVWNAVEGFFRLDSATALRLFSYGYYPENLKGESLKNEIIRRLEEVINASKS